jgi:hypothetical protein
MASDEVLIQTAISSWEQVTKARRHTMFELFRGATISRSRAWRKPHFVPMGTPHRRKRCDVQRLAAGRAATPGIGRRLHRAPNRSVPASNLSEAANCWEDVHTELLSRFKTLSPKEWLESRGSLSPEEFERNPTRNRLAVLLGRTNHASYHFG